MRSTLLGFGFAALVVGALVGTGRADSPPDFKPATAAVEAAERDPANVDAARLAVKTAMDADAKAVTPWLLACRIDLAAGKRARGDERKTLLDAALNDLREATLRDRWDPEPFKWKALVLVELKASNADYVEALRSAAIRAAGETLTRDKYRAQTGEIATLKPGDPMPKLVYKNSKGEDVAASELYAKGPVIIELYRSAVWCGYCRKQIWSLDDNREKFEAEGISVVAISPDTAETLTKIETSGWNERKPFKTRLLSDPEGRQADRIGVLNPDTVRKGTQPDAFGLPFPTTIIVDQNGTVRFVKTHGDYRERVKIEDMVAEAKKIRLEFTPTK